jgi:hypothetical protein
MTDKDPKDMTVSEQLRWAANGEPYNGIDENIWTYPTGKIKALAEAVTGEWPSDNEIFSIVADNIDAELTEARELSLRQGAELWAKANGWPDFRDGEDFGAWLERCAFAKPIDDCGEPVRFGEHYGNMEQWLYSVSFCGRHAVLCGSAGEEMRVERGERVKRRVPEALGADGLPIKEDETVYDVETGEAYIVRLPCAGTGKTFFEGGGYRDPAYLTHTPPDTQERIDADALKSCVKYWDCDDLAERLRQEKAKVSARDLKIMQIEEGSAALADERLAELLRGMASDVEAMGGNWSKARVIELIEGEIRKIEKGE